MKSITNQPRQGDAVLGNQANQPLQMFIWAQVNTLIKNDGIAIAVAVAASVNVAIEQVVVEVLGAPETWPNVESRSRREREQRRFKERWAAQLRQDLQSKQPEVKPIQQGAAFVFEQS